MTCPTCGRERGRGEGLCGVGVHSAGQDSATLDCLRAALASRDAEVAQARDRMEAAEGALGSALSAIEAVEEQRDAALSEVTRLTRERDQARAGSHALDSNWSALHSAAMKPIRAAVGLPDGTVPEIVEAIREARGKALEAAVLAADNDLYGTMSHIVAIAEGKPPREPCQQRAAAVLRCLGALAAKGGANG